MKHQTSTGTPVLSVPPSTSGSIDAATLELLASWRQEDADATPEQIREAEEEFREFKRAMNENRSSAGEPLLYP